MDLRLDLLLLCGKQQGVFLATGAGCRRDFSQHVAITHHSNLMSDVQDVRERLV